MVERMSAVSMPDERFSESQVNAMSAALMFSAGRSRRACEEVLDLIAGTEEFLEFHGESPRESDHHRRVIALLSELHVLLSRIELQCVRALPTCLSETENPINETDVLTP